jgi:hypothetical protein
MRRIVLSSLLVFTFTNFFSGRALGCGCIQMFEKPDAAMARAALVKAFNDATAVFSGKVVEAGRLKLKFEVDKVWKGEVGKEFVMSTGARQYDEETFSTSSCDYNFKPGEEYLVYAYPVDPDLHPGSTDLQGRECTRTKLAKSAEQEMKDLDEVQPHETRGTRQKSASGNPAEN